MGFREEFMVGVNRFIKHAKTIDDWSLFWVIRCPCVICDFTSIIKEEVVKDHLY